jgi:hypothetical protein
LGWGFRLGVELKQGSDHGSGGSTKLINFVFELSKQSCFDKKSFSQKFNWVSDLCFIPNQHGFLTGSGRVNNSSIFLNSDKSRPMVGLVQV